MLKSELIAGSDVFEVIDADQWDALAQGGITDTPFQSYAYQKAWWTHLGPGELYTVVVREGDTLKGIGSFYLLDGRLYFNGSKEETDYLDIITPGADAPAVWQAILTCLCSNDFPTWEALVLHCIPAASPTRHILPRLSESRGFVFSEEVDDVCPVLELADTFDDYLADLDKKQRHEIRRKNRRANGAGAQIHTVSEDEDVHPAVDKFLDLLQKSLPEKEDWLNPGRIALFHDVAEAAQRAGKLQLTFISVDQDKLAGLFNFAHNGRIWVYNSGLDMTKYSRLSLGVVLTADAIARAIENGYHAFDFLRGDETYKYRFGAEDTHIYRIEIEKP